MARRELFDGRALALLLSDKVDDNDLTHTFDESAEDVTNRRTLNPKLDPTKKVGRLRANQMPSWVKEDEEEEVIPADTRAPKAPEDDEYVPQHQASKEDRRLQRLEQARSMARGERSERRRYEAEVIAGPEDDEEEAQDEDSYVPGDVKYHMRERAEEDEEEDEDAIARRRAAIRERLKNLKREEQEEMKRPAPRQEEEEEELEEDEEEESEYETDTDESEAGGPLALLKPVFIPKHKRELTKEQEREEREWEEQERKKQLVLEERKREARNIVAEQIRREAEGMEGADDGYGSEAGAPDDDDKPEDDALEFEAWRLRELFRIKRDREQRMAREKEKAEIERRRNMTDEERAAENARLGLNKPKEKSKWKFMQKYYHKGAFYMDDESVRPDDVRLRAADAATGEDKFNKESMPAPMQVKAGKFGRSGQTKWTHLLNEDTTRKGDPSLWSLSEREQQLGVIRPAQNKWVHQLGGTGDIDTAGRRKPKK